MAEDAKENLAHRRLAALELADRLGNVAEACRRSGIDRTSFYEWKRRFDLHGLKGLEDRPTVAKSHPMTTPREVVARIEELALAHPAYGCNRIEAMLVAEGQRVSAITIQKILNDKGLGSRDERWLSLERQNAEHMIDLTPEQVAFLEKLNPCFRERHVESGGPGELLVQGVLMVNLKGLGRVYLHAVVDTFSSYAFGSLDRSNQPEGTAAMLHNSVLPFLEGLDLTVDAILTDRAWAFWGTERHPYRRYLARNDIEHKTTAESSNTNGFMERFTRTLSDEFLQPRRRSQGDQNLEAMQDDLDTWLHHYNHERPHLGYRNQGRAPWEAIELQSACHPQEGVERRSRPNNVPRDVTCSTPAAGRFR
jgi:transposase InsO family protein